MSVMSVPRHRRSAVRRCRTVSGYASVELLAMAMVAATPLDAAAQSAGAVVNDPRAMAAERTPQQAADLGAANAADQGVDQSIAVIDRATGQVVASLDGGRAYNAESILKLLTAAYSVFDSDIGFHSAVEVSDWLTDISLPAEVVSGIRSLVRASDLDDLVEMTSIGSVAMEIFGIDHTEC